jgi:hypothetical protein
MKALRQQEPDTSRRVEVVVAEAGSGAKEVLVRDMSHGDGVGWYVQRTIRLDAQQVDALMRALCCARQSCGRARSEGGASTTGEVAHRGSDKIVQLTRLGPGT